MKYFQVYKAPDTKSIEEEVDALNFVKEGISWPAFFFNTFFLLYHKMFLYFFIYLGLSLLLFALLDYYQVNEEIISIISFANTLLFALEANNIRSYYLEKRGFQLATIITASDKTQSEEKYIMQNYHAKASKAKVSTQISHRNKPNKSVDNNSIVPQVNQSEQ